MNNYANSVFLHNLCILHNNLLENVKCKFDALLQKLWKCLVLLIFPTNLRKHTTKTYFYICTFEFEEIKLCWNWSSHFLSLYSYEIILNHMQQTCSLLKPHNVVTQILAIWKKLNLLLYNKLWPFPPTSSSSPSQDAFPSYSN